MATTLVKVGAQWKLTGLFDFSTGDTFKDNGGVARVLGKVAGAKTYIPMTLPANSMVVGGEIIVVTASDDSGTSTASLGDAGSGTRYLNAVDLKSTGRTALTLTTTLLNTSATDLLLVLTPQNGDATAGRAIINVDLVITGRQNENLKMV